MFVRFLSAFISVLPVLTVGVSAAAQNAPPCTRQAVTAQQQNIAGQGALCVAKGDTWARLLVEGLTPGDAYTVLWVYFDDPTLCQTSGACGGPDFGGDNPLGVFGRMDSAVAPDSGDMAFSGRINGFVPTAGSQIWFWLFGHGPADQADARHLARQLLTPEDPTAGAPHLGIVGGPLGFPAAVVTFDIP